MQNIRNFIFTLVLLIQPSQAQWTQTNKISRVSSFIHNGEYLFASTYEGIIRSKDNGITWESADSGLTTLQVNCLVKKDTSLFAGTVGGGVFKSTNYGKYWVQINNGITAKWIMALLEFDGQILAGSEGGDIFQSFDDGNT